MKKILILSALLLVAFLGCGKNEDNPVQKALQKTDEKGNQAKNALDLNGHWESECSKSTLQSFLGMKTKERFEFSLEGTVTWKQLFFNDNDCKEPYFAVIVRGDYERQGAGDVLKTAEKMKFNFKETKAVVKSEKLQTFFKTTGFCGKKDFPLNEEVDISSTTQTSSTCPHAYSVPRATYDLALVEGNKLFLGNDAATENEADRPTDVDRTKSYTKQAED